MRDRLILAIPWREFTRNMTRRLSSRGLSVHRTFDLQEARRSLERGRAASGALHGSGQYLVLQVRCGKDSAALVVRGDGNSTEITLLRSDDSEGRAASEVFQEIEQILSLRVDPRKATAIVPSGSEDD